MLGMMFLFLVRIVWSFAPCRMQRPAPPCQPQERKGRKSREGQHGVVCTGSCVPPQVSPVPRRKPLACGRRRSGRRCSDTGSEAAGSPDVGANARRRADQVSQGGDQRVRFRAGVPQQRPAGAFRLHGFRYRRRGDAAGEPGRFPEIPAPAPSAGRREQGRYERQHSGHKIRLADRACTGRWPALFP